ncbi:MAG: Gfo/Idh/MocA family oxidoreductase [Sedimentisphaerales bacterium]|nr:Gfo/Idh/MocA family oxidoreductase [Sedimentisphaerales bacterium]
MNRRAFLRTTAAVGACAVGLPYFVPSRVMGNAGITPPSEKIVMGCIGVGSMGGGHLRGFSAQEDVRVAAVCDLRRAFREKAKQHVDGRYGDTSCATYHDFRELLARGDIDAVCVATPDHWHALVGIEAARNGKDMYLEKPADVHVSAAKALREAVTRYGVVFQFGTQQRSGRDFRFACELARNRRIGKLKTIVVGSVPGATLANQPLQPQPDPQDFDYDMWLGPAPWSDYTFQRAASRAEGSPGYWMHIHDYCLGCLSGAWGIHHVDIAQWGNDSDDTGPLEIEGTGSIPEDGLCDTPTTWWVEHTYANGVRMIHAERSRTVREFPQFESKTLQYSGVGVLFVGSDGWVVVSRGGIDAEPKSLLQETFDSAEMRLPVSNNHKRNFLECVRSREQTICPVETAVRSDTICHLDDIAIRLGRKLRWNPQREEFVNDDQANRLLARPLRSPWRL